jgi:hypothetical protein
MLTGSLTRGCLGLLCPLFEGFRSRFFFAAAGLEDDDEEDPVLVTLSSSSS